MIEPGPYTRRERLSLWGMSAVGFVGLNSAFVIGLARPGALETALRNPISLAFMAEAILMLGLLAYLLPRWGVLRVRRAWFVGLSILGGLLFALPVALLWRPRK